MCKVHFYGDQAIVETFTHAINWLLISFNSQQKDN